MGFANNSGVYDRHPTLDRMLLDRQLTVPGQKGGDLMNSRPRHNSTGGVVNRASSGDLSEHEEIVHPNEEKSVLS